MSTGMSECVRIPIKTSPTVPDATLSVASSLATNRVLSEFMDSPEGREWRRHALMSNLYGYFMLDDEMEKADQEMRRVALEWLDSNDVGTITDDDLMTAAIHLEGACYDEGPEYPAG